jgi:hypothetical protein
VNRRDDYQLRVRRRDEAGSRVQVRWRGREGSGPIETVRRSDYSSMKRLQTDPDRFSASDRCAASDRLFTDFPGELRFEVCASLSWGTRRVTMKPTPASDWGGHTPFLGMVQPISGIWMRPVLDARELCSVMTQIGLASPSTARAACAVLCIPRSGSSATAYAGGHGRLSEHTRSIGRRWPTFPAGRASRRTPASARE